MGRRATVDQLPAEQRDFVINECLRYRTDRQISADFETTFGESLPKSSLNYWRNSTGNELVERFGLQRMLVKSFVGELEAKGIDVKEDRYAQLIEDLEEHLLARTADLVTKDPLKLLEARQFDESMRIKRETLELKREQIALERQKLLGTLVDPAKQAVEFLTEFFEYLKDDAEGVQFVQKHARAFNEFIAAKYAA